MLKTNLLGFEDVLLKPNKSSLKSRRDADISVQFGPYEFTCPVVAANMKSVITPYIYDYFIDHGWYAIYHRLNGPDDVYSFAEGCKQSGRICSISIGVKQEWIDLLSAFSYTDMPVEYITVDVAHSHNDNVIDVLRAIKRCCPAAYVTLGNGCTKEWAEWCDGLYKEGLINAIKIGIGVSQSCRTRQYTGFGSTTLGSLKEVRDTITPNGLLIISDGGITVEEKMVRMNPLYDDKEKKIIAYQAIYKKDIHIGDANKALVFGADMVMSGAIFSNCNDVPAAKDGYYGNASIQATGDAWHVEGDVVSTDCENKPSLKEMMHLVQDSIRSAISYSGGKSIEEMRKLTKWKVV